MTPVVRGTYLMFLAFFLWGCASQPQLSRGCQLPLSERMWLEAGYARWAEAMTREFNWKPASPPSIFVLGSMCVWGIGIGAGAAFNGIAPSEEIQLPGMASPIYGAVHSGTFRAPNGAEIPTAPIAFTGIGLDGTLFLVIAASDVWQAAFRSNDVEYTPAFLQDIVTHELTHTQQPTLLARLGAAAAAPGVGKISGDEFLQERYKDTPAYVAAIAEQQIALVAAIREPDERVRRRMAAEIMAAYRARQASYFSASPIALRDLEDDFLTMEGLAVWLSLTVAGCAQPKCIADAYAAKEEGSWVQKHGALFAALLDTFGSQWRREVLGPRERRLTELLEVEGRRQACCRPMEN